MRPRIVRKFRAKWPELSLSLDLNDQFVDIIGSGIDIAIRFASRLEDSSLVSKGLATTRDALEAAPAYLKRHGSPAHVVELKNHRCLDTSRPVKSGRTWHFRVEDNLVEISVSCATTAILELPLILAACLAEGVLIMPEILSDSEIASGRLVEILPESSNSTEWGTSAVDPARNSPAKVLEFMRFIEEEPEHLQTIARWAPLESPDETQSHSSRPHRIA